nr:hypothetical protein [Tanacetum cinerariifolium]
ADKKTPKVNFRALFNEEQVNNADFVLPVENVEISHNRFANSLVGFFVLEKGPWIIRNQPLIITKWAPNLTLTKDVVTKVLVWTKIHKVPVVAYSEDGLSLIASQIGKPIMLDAFTSDMCTKPWGRIGFASALIEVSSDRDLKKEVIMAVSLLNEEGHTLEKMEVPETQSDGFTTVKNRKNKGKKVDSDQPRHIEGIKLTKPKPKYAWSVKSSQPASKSKTNTKDVTNGNVGYSEHDAQSDSEVEEMALEYGSKAVTQKGTSNASLCNKGCRIILGCNKDVVDVLVEAQSDQAIHAKIFHKADNKSMYCSFIYAGNLHDRVNRLRNELDEVQKALDQDPSNSVLRDEEAVYVQTFLGTDMICTDLNSDGLFLKRVFDLSNDNMTKPVMNEEIKKAMFGTRDVKAPSLDGFTSLFFKKGWDVVGQDVCNVVSKILTNRIIKVIKEVISDNQSAFVSGRRISDNILITQELMHNYHRDRGKRGLRQGDPLYPYLFTLVMEILTLILQIMVHESDIFRTIRTCNLHSSGFSFFWQWQLSSLAVETSSASGNSITGSKRGLRQDDLFLIARGDVDSAKVIMDSLNEFKDVSGLVPSIPKSMAFFCNVLNHVKTGMMFQRTGSTTFEKGYFYTE